MVLYIPTIFFLNIHLITSSLLFSVSSSETLAFFFNEKENAKYQKQFPIDETILQHTATNVIQEIDKLIIPR